MNTETTAEATESLTLTLDVRSGYLLGVLATLAADSRIASVTVVPS